MLTDESLKKTSQNFNNISWHYEDLNAATIIMPTPADGSSRAYSVSP